MPAVLTAGNGLNLKLALATFFTQEQLNFKYMSWVRIWVHMVFSTKDRVPFMHTPELRSEIFKHIKENAESKGIWLDSINGYNNHAHCLVSLGKEDTISKVAHLIKGESSYWINKSSLTKPKFIWQDDYWAVGLSESHLVQTRNYIHNQEKHHAQKSFKEEIDEFMNKYGWQYIQE